MKATIIKVLGILLIGGLISCEKFLDEKPDATFFLPNSLGDLQAVLDQTDAMNAFVYGNSLTELAAADIYATYASWQSATLVERQNYIWEGDDSDINNWREPYSKPIYTSNVVLDQLGKLKDDNDLLLHNQIEGSALFYRALAFYELAQIYCKPYSSTAKSDLGIVLRQTVDLEAKSVRSTVEETYNKILTDLNKAVELLPSDPGYVTRPGKAAAYALLARVYLSMRDYENALKFAQNALNLNSRLLDFNDLILTNFQILPQVNNNPEVILYSSLAPSYFVYPFVAKIDSNLYRSYSASDIRKAAFFIQNTGTDVETFRFRGSYDSGYIVFNGMSTGELYLIKAECQARSGNAAAAMVTLNTLLKNRYAKASFSGFTASNADEAKSIILTERRKELVCRGQRWTDLRRLNLEGANISLKRVLNGQTYTLPPNDNRWVLPIPLEEIKYSGIPQNPK